MIKDFPVNIPFGTVWALQVLDAGTAPLMNVEVASGSKALATDVASIVDYSL
jgi:hypothetical protein